MLGLSKTFVIALFISFIIAFGFRDYMTFFKIIGWYIAVKIIWNILTK